MRAQSESSDMFATTTEFSCFGDSWLFDVNDIDDSMDCTTSEELKEKWNRLCSGYVATGATLGVMAVVLVLFLFMLCLPWAKCRRWQRCLNRRQTDGNSERHPNPMDQEAFDNFYPLSILDLFPPSMLPKLPDYDECIRNGVPSSMDDAPPPATPPPHVVARERIRTRASVEQQATRSSTASDMTTPPPSYSAAQSPLDSGEPVAPSPPTTAAVIQNSQPTSPAYSPAQIADERVD